MTSKVPAICRKLPDGLYAVGSLDEEVAESGGYACTFFAERFAGVDALCSAGPDNLTPISSIFVTSEIAGKREGWLAGCEIVNSLPEGQRAPYTFRTSGSWVGCKTYGSAIVKDFLEAYFGLADWFMMYRDDYFDEMLLPEAPTRLITETSS